MTQWDYIGFAYAVFVATGGIIGYLKAGSIPSLVSGVSFGLVAAAGAYQTSVQPANVIVSLCASGLLTVVMGLRFYSTHKVFPAGVLFLISLLMVGRCVWRMNSN